MLVKLEIDGRPVEVHLSPEALAREARDAGLHAVYGDRPPVPPWEYRFNSSDDRLLELILSHKHVTEMVQPIRYARAR